jgi:hypothetical protein
MRLRELPCVRIAAATTTLPITAVVIKLPPRSIRLRTRPSNQCCRGGDSLLLLLLLQTGGGGDMLLLVLLYPTTCHSCAALGQLNSYANVQINARCCLQHL